MFNGRRLLLAPALLGAFFMASSRNKRGMFGQFGRRRSQSSWLTRSLLGGLGARRTGLRLFR